MAIKLNLLPPKYGALGNVGKVLKATRALGVIAMALFFVFALAVSAFFIISTITINNLNSDVNSLKSQVTAQQTSEQQIVLVKDRIGKIKTVLATPDALKNLTAINTYISGLSGTTALTDLSIDPLKVDMSLTFRTNADLTNFMTQISQDKNFGSIALTSFGFAAATGYSVEITTANK